MADGLIWIRRAAQPANILLDTVMIQRRSQLRLPDSELVMICWEQRSATCRQLGNVKNASIDGLGVLVDYPLPIGTQVTISYGEGELTGFVRHHSQQTDGHVVGIEFIGPVKNRCYTLLSC